MATQTASTLQVPKNNNRMRDAGTYLSVLAASAGLAYGATLLLKHLSAETRTRVSGDSQTAHHSDVGGAISSSQPTKGGRVKPDPKLGGLIVVVGVGGVGSHAAHILTRSGATNLRLVDFDLITLSSLNRHCSAVHTDVGRLKTTVLAEYIRSYADPAALSIEEIPDTFCKKTADQVLRSGEGRQKIAYVLDCIDNTETKAELLAQCLARGLPVVSSMGAGSRADPTRIHISNISEVSGFATRHECNLVSPPILATQYDSVISSRSLFCRTRFSCSG